MGKLIRNGIEYGGGNGTDIFEVTQAEYDALKQAGTLVHNALYVISDAPNLNATASDIEYSSGVTVKQKIDGKADISTTCKYIQTTITWNANTNRFDIPSQTPRPVQPQQCLIGRNSSTGALYALWYVSTDENFSLGAVISGNAPSNNQTCYVNYVIPNT